MCGIVGFLDNTEKKEDIIKKMTDKILHRGPDGVGYYIDENVALGHRRLAVIDIKAGKQPMISEDENYVIVYNGEIYNFKLLKNELKKLGYNFFTNSDTEVILNGYIEWKENLPSKLRGMFAFSIYNKKEKELFCARDNFGIKPFYYYFDNDVFMFSSEIKAFLLHPKFKKILNEELLPLYFLFGYTPSEKTLFKNVFKLNPGCILKYKDGKIEISKYYEVSFKSNKETSYEESVEKLSNVVKDAVKCNLISDVEVGAFLSSGVDSSYIVSLAKPKKTYTAYSKVEGYDEYKDTKELANILNFENIGVNIDKDEYIENIDKIMYFADEPIADPAALALYFLSKEASKNLKVVLSGDGADEFFAGYKEYKNRYYKKTKKYDTLPYKFRNNMACLFNHKIFGKYQKYFVKHGNLTDINFLRNQRFYEFEINRLLKENKKLDVTSVIDTKNLNKTKSVISKMQINDINIWLANDILQKTDKMSMANSLEVRVPFIDKYVFDVASSLKDEYKINEKTTKVILRDAAKKSIPNDSYNRVKKGFYIPIKEWILDEKWYSIIKNTFENNSGDFLNKKYILKLLNEHKNNKKNNSKKIWIIFCFLRWYEVYFK